METKIFLLFWHSRNRRGINNMKVLLFPVESVQDFHQSGHKESFFFNSWEIVCVQDIPMYCASNKCSSHLHQEKLTESQTQPHVTVWHLSDESNLWGLSVTTAPRLHSDMGHKWRLNKSFLCTEVHLPLWGHRALPAQFQLAQRIF